MNVIGLKKAVSEIHQIVDEEERSPFFFIVGAGISSPDVPLASEIEKHCRERAKKYYDTPELPNDRPMMERYSYWFQQGYPTPSSRQNYLSKTMAPVGISRANDKLARILVSGSSERDGDKPRTIARTVFTTNFDEMLSKAVELYGERPLICDHPETVSRMRIDSSRLQIIHVHGSFWFYDFCNTEQEIRKRRESGSMSRSLFQALQNYSPIVVGYSGWEDDLVMAALKDRISIGMLGTPIYWFCYKKSEIGGMPPWLLKESADVNFVVADEEGTPSVSGVNFKQAGTASPDAPPAASTPLKVAKPGDVDAASQVAGAHETGTAPDVQPESSGEPVLSADVVFAEIIKQLQLPVPPLVQNPLDFFLRRLQSSVPVQRSIAGPDEYNFEEVIKRVMAARDAEKIGQGSLEPFWAEMKRGNYAKAIREARGVDFYSLPMGDRREALFGLKEAARGLYDNSDEELLGYEYIVTLADLLSEQDKVDAGVREQVSDALFCWAMTLEVLSRRQEAIAIYDRLTLRYGAAPEPAIRLQVAKALFNKGAILNSMDRNEESLRPYEELKTQFDQEKDPVIVENVAKAMFNKGWSLVSLKRYAEGVAAYTELIERYGAATEPALREQVAKSLLNRGMARSSLGESVEEMADYDELVHRFQDAPEAALRERVAKGLLYKGATLATLKDPQGAIDVYDDVVRRFGEAEELVLREQVAKALLSKGYTLGTMERSEEEMEVYAELLRRFDQAPEPSLQEQVAKAIFNRGATMVEMKRPEDAVPIYASLVERFGNSPERAIREQVAKALLSRARLHENAGEIDLAARLCEETVARFDNPDDQALSDYVERARAKLKDLAKLPKALPQAAGAMSTIQ